jgi:hypothetical protein
MKKCSIILAILTVLFLAGQALAVAPQQVMIGDGARAVTVKAAATAPVAADRALVIAQSPNGADPCANPNVAKSSVVVNIGAATTAQMIAAGGAGTATYVCGLTASLEGTTPTIKLITGTQAATACDTGPADLTGAMKPTSGAMVTMGYGGTIVKSAPASQICGTTTGAGSSFQGVITYVTK